MRKWIWTAIILVCCAGAIIYVRRRVGDGGTPGKADRQKAGSATENIWKESSAIITKSGEPPSASTNVAPKPLRAASIPSSMRAIWGLDGASDFIARKTAAQNVGTKLSKPEIQSLYAFLRSSGEQQGMDLISFNSIKNDVMDRLLQQEVLPEDLSGNFISMYRDRTLDVICRDYCVQHLFHLYEAKWTNVLLPSSNQVRTEILDACWEAASEQDTRIAGTALIGLKNLSETDHEIDRSKLAAKVSNLAGNPKSDSQSRITAVRLCGDMGLVQTLPVLRSISAADSEMLLRCAAIASLGDIGDERDLEQLSGLLTDAGAGAQAKVVATVSIKTIQNRLESQK